MVREDAKNPVKMDREIFWGNLSMIGSRLMMPKPERNCNSKILVSNMEEAYNVENCSLFWHKWFVRQKQIFDKIKVLAFLDLVRIAISLSID